MTVEALACTAAATNRSGQSSSKNNKNIYGLSNANSSASQISPGGQILATSSSGASMQNRECIQIVSFFHRKTAETACLEARLAKNLVTRVCVIRPNSIFYTLSESLSRKLYCCLATRDNAAHAGKPIFTCRKSIVEIINLSHDGHTRVGVLCTDGMLHILLLHTHVPQQWDRVVSIATDLDVSVYREIAYSRSFNSLFWPLPNGDGYTIVMYDIEHRQMRTLLTRVKNCTLQVKQDALVVLFYDHGVLFVPFTELNGKFSSKSPERALMNNSTDDLTFRPTLTSDSGLGRSCSMLDFTTEALPIHADYWNPSTASIKRVQAEAFEPSVSDQHLRGYCLSHDRTVVFAMYGTTVYRLSGAGCAPLASIEVPPDMDSTFRVMFLGRITVLQGDTMTAAYLNSSKPVKVLHKTYRSAGFGFVWDETGVYQIRMCNPVEMPDDLQTEIMAYSPAYRTANAIGRAINGEQLTADSSIPSPGFQFEAQKHLASPALLSIAGAYTSTNEDLSEKFIKAAHTGWQSIDDFKGSRSKLGSFRRLENIRRKIKSIH